MSSKSIIVIASVIGSLTVLAAVGVGLGVGLSQITLKSFNGSCTSTSNCMTQYGLICINNTCSCNSISLYNGGSYVCYSQSLCMFYACSGSFFKWAIPGLFYFSPFQKNITIFTAIYVKICPYSIQCWDSNP